MFIFNLLKYISYSLMGVCLLIFVCCVWKAIRSIIKRNFSVNKWLVEIRSDLVDWFGNHAKWFLIAALLSILLTNTAVHQFVGIYNLKILPAGTYCFYVEAFQSDGKTYTVPAEVKIKKESEEIGDKNRTYTYYYIERFFFSNGNEIELNVWDSVEINEPAYHIDLNGDEWNLTLLNKHAYSPQIKETNNVNRIDVTFLAIEVIPILFLLFAMYRKIENNEI